MNDYQPVLDIQKSREWLDRHALKSKMTYEELIDAIIVVADNENPKYLENIDFTHMVWRHAYIVTGYKKLGKILDKTKRP